MTSWSSGRKTISFLTPTKRSATLRPDICERDTLSSCLSDTLMMRFFPRWGEVTFKPGRFFYYYTPALNFCPDAVLDLKKVQVTYHQRIDCHFAQFSAWHRHFQTPLNTPLKNSSSRAVFFLSGLKNQTRKFSGVLNIFLMTFCRCHAFSYDSSSLWCHLVWPRYSCFGFNFKAWHRDLWTGLGTHTSEPWLFEISIHQKKHEKHYRLLMRRFFRFITLKKLLWYVISVIFLFSERPTGYKRVNR